MYYGTVCGWTQHCSTQCHARATLKLPILRSYWPLILTVCSYFVLRTHLHDSWVRIRPCDLSLFDFASVYCTRGTLKNTHTKSSWRHLWYSLKMLSVFVEFASFTGVFLLLKSCQFCARLHEFSQSFRYTDIRIFRITIFISR